MHRTSELLPNFWIHAMPDTRPLVHLIAGARPNFMKIAPLLRAIAADGRLQARLIHTGQHFDKDMNDVFDDKIRFFAPVHRWISPERRRLWQSILTHPVSMNLLLRHARITSAHARCVDLLSCVIQDAHLSPLPLERHLA